jgi:hypothetical protein
MYEQCGAIKQIQTRRKSRNEELRCYYGEYLFRRNVVGESGANVRGGSVDQCQGNQTEPSMRSNFRGFSKQKPPAYLKYDNWR